MIDGGSEADGMLFKTNLSYRKNILNPCISLVFKDMGYTRLI